MGPIDPVINKRADRGPPIILLLTRALSRTETPPEGASTTRQINSGLLRSRAKRAPLITSNEQHLVSPGQGGLRPEVSPSGATCSPEIMGLADSRILSSSKSKSRCSGAKARHIRASAQKWIPHTGLDTAPNNYRSGSDRNNRCWEKFHFII